MSGVPIRLSRCGRTYPGGTRAVHATDLDIGAGETLVLLGPSGCGKTTLLRLIAGLEVPDAGGQVLFDEIDVTAQPIERRHVGMVFQSYALFPNLTVRGNVEYGLKVRGLPAEQRRARVQEMLAMMRIEALAGRAIDQLSGGQRQRVALARALAPRPRVLLLDEPLTALDARLREDLRLEIDQLLRGLGITTVHVTHDQAEAMALGDRIAVMNEGRIVQIGTPREIYLQPVSAFVAGFIGTMNVLTGRVEGDRFVLPAGRLPLPAGADAVGGPAIVALMFRPEDVELVAPADAHLAGRVLSAFFLGDHARFVLALEGGPTIALRVPADTSLRAGDIAHLTVRRCTAVPL